MNFHTAKIRPNEEKGIKGTSVFFDDMEIKGVTGYELKAGAEASNNLPANLAELTLKIIVKVG